MLIPRTPVPNLKVPTLNHGDFVLQNENPENFSLVVFYRGLHCPICAKYLLELARLVPELKKRFYQRIANDCKNKLGLRKEDIFISLIEVNKENWSFGNGEMQYGPTS